MFKCRAAGADGGRVAVGDDVFSVTTASKYEVDYLGQSTKGDLNLKLDPLHSFGTHFLFLLASFREFSDKASVSGQRN